MVSQSVVVCLVALLAVASATDVDQCGNSTGRSLESLRSDVTLSPCKKVPCTLKKGTNQGITIKFKPEKKVYVLDNNVSANVLGASVPFIGVDGLSICDKVYLETGEKAGCPLESGTTYYYKDSFPILSFYPPIHTVVTWALKSGDKDIVCFKVAARIK